MRVRVRVRARVRVRVRVREGGLVLGARAQARHHRGEQREQRRVLERHAPHGQRHVEVHDAVLVRVRVSVRARA